MFQHHCDNGQELYGDIPKSHIHKIRMKSVLLYCFPLNSRDVYNGFILSCGMRRVAIAMGFDAQDITQNI